jgi:hypothetical protein
MIGRLPSITETEDFATLAYALNHGELPGWLSEYTRDALVTAGWITADGQLNEVGLAKARDWAEIRQSTTKGFATSGAFTPRWGQS